MALGSKVVTTPLWKKNPFWSAVGGLVLLGLFLGAVYSYSALSSATSSLRHTDNVRVKVALLRSTLLDAETSARGYLVTGRRGFLEPHDRAQSVWRHQLDEVRALTADNADQQARLHRLEDLIERELEALAGASAAYEAGQRGEALLPAMEVSKRAMDAVRAELTNMERAEAVLDHQREREMTRRWGWTTALLIGGALGFMTFVATVARQRRASEARRERAEEERRFLQDVFAGIEDGITIQDTRGALVFANTAAAHLTGFDSVAALLSAPMADLMKRFELFDEHGQPIDRNTLPARTVLSGGVVAEPVVVKYRRRATGEERWSTLEAFPVRDAGGKVVRAVNVFRDITARRRDDERRTFLLRAADELSSSLDYEVTLASVARLAVPVLADWCAVDIMEEGRPKRVATAHVDPAKIAVVAEIERRYPSDPNARTGVAEILRTGEPQLLAHIPRELLTAAAKDAEHLRLIDALELRSYLAVPLTVGTQVLGAITFAMAESHRVYVDEDLAFARGLADRAALAIENARLYREAERGRREAEQQARFAETFVGMLGHDLRNPLNAIIMTTKLVRRTIPGDHSAVDRILSSAHRMSNMVAQLLDLTRSRIAGGITLDRKVADVGAVVSEVVDELRRTYPAREIAWSRPAPVPAPVDRDRLAQVVSNLVGNALEHGDAARPVTVVLTAREGAAELSVHNAGAPIPPEVMPVLFEPFRQTMARGARSKGLGLGLFITQQIVRAHGGDLEVTSTEEAGTTFRVVLPHAGAAFLASQESLLVS